MTRETFLGAPTTRFGGATYRGARSGNQRGVLTTQVRSFEVTSIGASAIVAENVTRKPLCIASKKYSNGGIGIAKPHENSEKRSSRLKAPPVRPANFESNRYGRNSVWDDAPKLPGYFCAGFRLATNSSVPNSPTTRENLISSFDTIVPV